MHFNKHLVFFSAIFIFASASYFLEEEWTIWKSKYGKTYSTKSMELRRRKAWEATWDKVQKHNQLAAQGLKNYRLEMNQFADKTLQERKIRSCFRSSQRFQPSNHSQILSKKLVNTPTEVDWRKSKCMASVKNQGEFCGSCWAFAADERRFVYIELLEGKSVRVLHICLQKKVGVIESRYCIKRGKLVLLSEQQLVDCDGTNEGCCGGFPIAALAYIKENGIMKSKQYRYSEKSSDCMYDEDKAITVNTTKYYTLPDEENMATEVALNGPITVGIGASDEFMLYKDGIYDGACEELNHAIIIVGYGSKPHAEDPDLDEDYWIIRNSWGKEWGEGGYAKMKRNVNQCGIGSEAATLDLV